MHSVFVYFDGHDDMLHMYMKLYMVKIVILLTNRKGGSFAMYIRHNFILYCEIIEYVFTTYAYIKQFVIRVKMPAHKHENGGEICRLPVGKLLYERTI